MTENDTNLSIDDIRIHGAAAIVIYQPVTDSFRPVRVLRLQSLYRRAASSVMLKERCLNI